MEKKHILVISQYFYPEPFRINDICQEWVKRGYKVTVVTGIPNYPEGKFYDGYGYRKKRIEKWNGITILRLPLIPRRHSSIGLIANYLSFVCSGFLWKCFSKVKADYVFTFEVSPMTQALVGVWYAKKHNIPNYLYVQDLWPENVEIVTGIHNQSILKPIGKMVDYIYRNCDEIFATSPSFVKEICKRGVSEEKVHYWPQYAEDFYKPLEKKPVPEIPDEDVFKIIFTGNIGYAQGLDILPKTAELLKKEEGKVKFYIVGEGRYKEEFLKELKERNVEEMFCMIGRQPSERIPELLAACDAAFLSFMDNPLFEMTIPAKLQSYMACGMPIIAAASGETKRIIEEAECGVCCGIGDEKRLACVIKGLATDEKNRIHKLRINAREFYQYNYEKRFLMDQIERYFNKGKVIMRAIIEENKKLICCSSKYYLYYHRGNFFCKSIANEKIENIGNIKLSIKNAICSKLRLLERMFRLEPRCGYFVNENDAVVSYNGKVLLISCPKREVIIEHFFREKMSNTLGFCPINNLPGFDDTLLYGEYFQNYNKKEVSIYSRKEGKWSKVYTFKAGSIKHIHSIFVHPKRDSIIVFTGDTDEESAIWEIRNGFKDVKVLVSGKQMYRSDVGIPYGNGIIYATDTPLEQNAIYFLEEINGEVKIEKIKTINGPCIYGLESNNKLLLSTSVEPDSNITGIRYLFTNVLGKGVKDHYSYIYSGNINDGFFEIYKGKKDVFPMALFEFGNFQFINDENGDALVFAKSIKKFDGKTFRLI